MRSGMDRRALLRGLLATGGLGWAAGLPGRLARAAGGSDHRFLFVFVDGGWDPTWVFLPAFDVPAVDMPMDGSDIATAGDLRWVSGPGRPSVDAFFRRWGASTCVINGLEVRSIAHERCRQLLFTGGGLGGAAGVPSRIASSSLADAPFGNVVLSGPAFTNSENAGAMRVGDNGQLRDLLTRDAVEGTALRLPGPDLSALEDAFVAQRARGAAAAARPGAEARLTGAYRDALDTLTIAEDARDLLRGGEGDTTSELHAAVQLLASGFARCAVVADRGVRNERWDHHSDLSRQGPSFDMLFRRVSGVLEELSNTQGHRAPTLLDEVTVVVMSEMGRFPRLNSSLGKDHWMTTSLMLLGGGVRGGQVFGGTTSALTGAAIDPSSGAVVASGGVVIQPAEIGATLLTLAGLDPEAAFPGTSVLGGVLA